MRSPPGNGGSSGSGWWIASGIMALLLIAGIILLISMPGGGNGNRSESVADSDENDESEQTSEQRGSENGTHTPPDDSASSPPALPSNIESGDVHTGSYGHILPLLPISQADYVFLEGYTLEDDENGCWTAGYDIAYKGEWDVQRLDAVFESDEMLEVVERGLPKLYPDVDIEGSETFINVYQYDGGESASDYEDVVYEDYKLYWDTGGSCKKPFYSVVFSKKQADCQNSTSIG